jgi:hypothetical protein
MGYSSQWSATCPRCNRSFGHADLTCENCGKGQILAAGHDPNSVNFGCGNCEKPFLFLKCPACGADIARKQISVQFDGLQKSVVTIGLILLAGIAWALFRS